MSKVKVSKEVFDALESTKKWELDGEGWEVTLLRRHIGKDFMGIIDILNTLDLFYFYKILRNGYELELTPNEKVLGDYNLLKSELEKSSNNDEKRELNNCINVMLATLSNLGVYIEGVNK